MNSTKHLVGWDCWHCLELGLVLQMEHMAAIDDCCHNHTSREAEWQDKVQCFSLQRGKWTCDLSWFTLLEIQNALSDWPHIDYYHDKAVKDGKLFALKLHWSWCRKLEKISRAQSTWLNISPCNALQEIELQKKISIAVEEKKHAYHELFNLQENLQEVEASLKVTQMELAHVSLCSDMLQTPHTTVEMLHL
jgi:hypothetical protein